MNFRTTGAVERYKFNNISCALTLTRWLGEEQGAKWWAGLVLPILNHLISGPIKPSLNSLVDEIGICLSSFDLDQYSKTRFEGDVLVSRIKMAHLATHIVSRAYVGLVELNASGITDDNTKNMSVPKALIQNRLCNKWKKVQSSQDIPLKNLTRKQTETVSLFSVTINETLNDIGCQCGVHNAQRIWTNVVLPASDFIKGRSDLYIQEKSREDRGDAGAAAVNNLRSHIDSLLYSVKDIEDELNIDHQFFVDGLIESAWTVYVMKDLIKSIGLSVRLDEIRTNTDLWTTHGVGRTC